jgi:hypothetical protein
VLLQRMVLLLGSCGLVVLHGELYIVDWGSSSCCCVDRAPRMLASLAVAACRPVGPLSICHAITTPIHNLCILQCCNVLLLLLLLC